MISTLLSLACVAPVVFVQLEEWPTFDKLDRGVYLNETIYIDIDDEDPDMVWRHECGHHIFDTLTIRERRALRRIFGHRPYITRYAEIGGSEEAFAESIANYDLLPHDRRWFFIRRVLNKYN